MTSSSPSNTCLPARNPPLPSPETLQPPPLRSNVPQIRNPHLRRRNKNPGFHATAGGRRSGPSTPHLRWKLDGGAKISPEDGGGCDQGKKNAAKEAAPRVSVRKLAAAVWHLRPPEAICGAGGRGGGDGTARVGLQPVPGHLQIRLLLKPKTAGYHYSLKNEISSPISVLDPKNGDFRKIELDTFAALPASALEKATKWDPESLESADDTDHLDILEDEQEKSLVSTLQLELQQANARISELEAERSSAKKKLDHFMKKLAEEKAAWRSREHEKVRAIIDGMKGDLNRERKNRQRLEIIHSKLVNELSEAKSSAKCLLQDYENERKARELLEEVCEELAKEIEEDKAEIEALNNESMKMREEVDEERKMLQMAEVWREERVQMKLVDAKLTLEAKYSQLSKLQQDVENFLIGQTYAKADIAVVSEADHLRQAINLVSIQEIKEFAYKPPPGSEDIFSIFEELNPREEANEREIEPCYGDGPAIQESEIHAPSPQTDFFLEKPTKLCANTIEQNEINLEGDSSWDTASHNEKQGSRNSCEGSESSVNKFSDECSVSASRNDGKLNTAFSEACFATTKQSRKKESSISRLWKSSCPNDSEHCKKGSVEITNGRPSSIAETGLSPPSMEHWSSPDSVSLHYSRGFKGCIECPRVMQKHSLKAKLMEARMESQKVQLRHVLKQKI
ncbi:uncharacterized protein [Typha latifolia]|uniref:uncharacterized protein n=1 Tax=Typha latifolia TaxID=4733 RepID=UPI003C2E9D7A